MTHQTGIEAIQPILDRVAATLPPAVTLTPEQEADRVRAEEEGWWQAMAPELGVPKRFRDAALDRGRPSIALDAVRQYLVAGHHTAGRCLVLAGAPQVGKTYAAVAGMRVLRRMTPRFQYFPALCGAFLDRARRAAALEQAKRTWFLVLDDLGAEYAKSGGLVEAFLDEVVWWREAEMLPTIVTTNLTPAEISHALSDRIVARLRGEWGQVCGAGTDVQRDDPDERSGR